MIPPPLPLPTPQMHICLVDWRHYRHFAQTTNKLAKGAAQSHHQSLPTRSPSQTMIEHTTSPDSQLFYVQYDAVCYDDFISYLKDNHRLDHDQRPTGRLLEQLISRVVFQDMTTKCVATNTTTDRGTETLRVRVEMLRGDYYVWSTTHDDIPGFAGPPKKGVVDRKASPSVSDNGSVSVGSGNTGSGAVVATSSTKTNWDPVNSLKIWRGAAETGTRNDYYDWSTMDRHQVASSPDPSSSPDSVFVTSRYSRDESTSYFIKGHAPAMDKSGHSQVLFDSKPPSPKLPPQVVSYSHTTTSSTERRSSQQDSTTKTVTHTRQQERIQTQEWKLPAPSSSQQQLVPPYTQQLKMQNTMTSPSPSLQVDLLEDQASAFTISNVQGGLTSVPLAPPDFGWFKQIPRMDPPGTASASTNEQDSEGVGAARIVDDHDDDDDDVDDGDVSPLSSDLDDTISDPVTRTRLKRLGNDSAATKKNAANPRGKASVNIVQNSTRPPSHMNGLANGHNSNNNGYINTCIKYSSGPQSQSATLTKSSQPATHIPISLANGYHKSINEPTTYAAELLRLSPFRQSMSFSLAVDTREKVEFEASVLFISGNKYLASLLLPPRKAISPWHITFIHRSCGLPTDVIGKAKKLGMKKLSSSKGFDEYDAGDTQLMMLILPDEKYAAEVLHTYSTSVRKHGILFGRPTHLVSSNNSSNGRVENGTGATYNSIPADLESNAEFDRAPTFSKSHRMSTSKSVEAILMPSLHSELYGCIGKSIREYVLDHLAATDSQTNGYVDGNESASEADEDDSSLEKLMQRKISDMEIGHLIVGQDHQAMVLTVRLA
ncbi:hypothetical protein SeMB42_g00915 [Synchytrium endobioticum]|uniref:Uncharacterized protein n=1 Tax=Synchytrium endobioticum TaxID=286115 RepID=A0A507DQU5_9FUNG|nr:hypothetical protein SeMB42_g00915 [Synchytrium endobioticum]